MNKSGMNTAPGFKFAAAYAAAALAMAWPLSPLAQSASPPAAATSGGAVGGPSSVSSQIRTDDTARQDPGAIPTAAPVQPFEQLRQTWQKDYGLTLGGDYNALYQHATQSLGKNDAAGNVVRLYGHWTPFNRGEPDAGSLVFKTEYRGRLGTSLSPQQLGPTAGYAGLTAPTFSDAGGLLTNLYWTQAFAGNRFAFNAGVVDVTDYLDVYGLVNVWTDFNNLSFSTNPTIPAPSQGLGAVARWMFTPNLYVVAGLADANGNPHRPQDFFKSFFDDHEFFYHAEFGWIESWDARYSDNVHVTLWGQDPREDAGIGRGKGGHVFSEPDRCRPMAAFLPCGLLGRRRCAGRSFGRRRYRLSHQRAQRLLRCRSGLGARAGKQREPVHLRGVLPVAAAAAGATGARRAVHRQSGRQPIDRQPVGRRSAAARGVLSMDLELNYYGADLFRHTLGRQLEEGE